MACIAASIYIYWQCWEIFLDNLIYNEPEGVERVLERIPTRFHAKFLELLALHEKRDKERGRIRYKKKPWYAEDFSDDEFPPELDPKVDDNLDDNEINV